MRLHFVGWLVTLSAAAALLTLVTYAYPQVIETKEEKQYARIELRGTLAKAPVKVVFHDNGRPITPNTEKTETWELTVKSMVLPVRFTGKELRGLVNRHAGQEVIVSAAASFRSVMIPSELPQRWGGIEPPPQPGLAAYFYAESLKPVEQPKAKPDPPAEKKMTGVLWCPASPYPGADLARGEMVVVGRRGVPLTGVTIYGGMHLDVYLANDRVKKLAKELTGRRVTITGEHRQVVVVTKWFGDKDGHDVPAPKGKSIWIPANEFEPMPTRQWLIWATDLKPLDPKLEPILGEPAMNIRGQVFSTFKRLPRSTDVVSVRVSNHAAADTAELKRLTVGNFPALLDGLKALEPNWEGDNIFACAGWSSCRFETSEGEFNMVLYLGGRGMLATPDGRRGWVEFVHPK